MTAAPRTSRSALLEVEEFHRSRATAGLLRADSLATDQVGRNPTFALLAGGVVALLIAGTSVATAYVSGHPPRGWQASGTFVVDRQTGDRYVVQAGRLRPAPTVTDALLAGAQRTPVFVPHAQLAQLAIGEPVPGPSTPERPPVLARSPQALTACTSTTGGSSTAGTTGTASTVDVYAASPRLTAGTADGLLVTAAGTSEAATQGVVLISGRRAHPISTAALLALGYSPAQVRTVPAAWLAAVPTGGRLDVPTRPAAGSPGGIAGVGAAGDVVTAQGSTTAYQVGGGQLHPFLNRTSALLAGSPVRAVSPAVLAAAPRGAAVGVLDAPSSPPRVPAREDAVTGCVRSSDGLVTVATAVGASGMKATTARPLPAASSPDSTSLTWHTTPGGGALIGPAGVDRKPSGEQAAGSGGAVLVVDGVGYPLADAESLRLLGYRRSQALAVPTAWLRLVAVGSALSATG